MKKTVMGSVVIGIALVLLQGIGQVDAGEAHDHENGPDAASAQAGHADEPPGNEPHVTAVGNIRLLHAWTRAGSGDHALVFVEIQNAGTQGVALSGGTSPIAASVEVVGFQLVNGKPQYSSLSDLEVAPGTEMKLQPEGLALRLTGLQEPLLQGDTFPLKVALGGSLAAVTVEVEAADAHQHGHAGHNH